MPTVKGDLPIANDLANVIICKIPIKERLNKRFSNTSLVSTLSRIRVSFFLLSSVNLNEDMHLGDGVWI